MRSKAPLAMLEQLVMLLVFALAAALCLQAFVLADRISKDSALYDHAVLDVQQAAEAVKHCGGDLQQAQQLLGGSAHRDCLIVPTENGKVTVTLTDSGHPLLGSAQITAADADGAPLYSTAISWQKEGGT